LEELKSKRNSGRINFYLVLAFTAVFFSFSFFPVTQGSLGDNPHTGMSQAEVNDWMDDSDGRGWPSTQLDTWAQEKLWDGNDPNSGSVESTVVLPGSPVPLGAVTNISIDITLVSLKEDGGTTSFQVGFFEGTCATLMSSDFTQAVAWYDSQEELLLPGQKRVITLQVQPGTYCLYFHYMNVDVNDNGYKATIEMEMAMYWPRGIFLPLSGLLAVIALPLWLQTQRIGKEYKKMKFPEGPDQKSREREVLDAVDAERVMGIDLTGAENVDIGAESAASSDPYVQQFIDQGYSPEVAAEHAAMYRDRAGEQLPAATDPGTDSAAAVVASAAAVVAPAEPVAAEPAAAYPALTQATPEVAYTEPVAAQAAVVEPVAAEPAQTTDTDSSAADSGAEWSDEQLLAAGWTQEQIDANRA
jgi:hypothetical protein